MEELRKQVAPRIPEAILEQMAVQLYISRECSQRVIDEGSTVRAISGNAVEHPAINTGIKATEALMKIMPKYKVD